MNYSENNVFAKILAGEIACDKVYENHVALAFHDVNPKAKVHILVIPKKSVITFDDFIQKSNAIEIVGFFQAVSKVLEITNLTKDGYRIISNAQYNGGQEVYHFHVHVLGGEKLPSF